MSYCLNPACSKPQNPDDVKFCQNCGVKLLLGDRYQPIKLIGQGGFGRTLLAIDRAASASKNQPPFCVIKQLVAQYPGMKRSGDLMRQEAAQLARLGQHPQIPALLDHFELETAQYLVQEFIDGQNLEQVLATEGLFSEQQVRSLLADLLPVLRFIHANQVIHRDLKPSNIIRPAGDGHLVLVDFGASKIAPETAKTETVIGSAGYAAPEQVMGRAEFASDLYSLGVTCVHLLTGMHPFDLYSIGEDAWIWRQYLPKPISSELRRVLDKLLQKATRQRYSNATEALQDLRLERVAPIDPPDQFSRTDAQTPQKIPSRKQSTRSQPTQAIWRCVQTIEGHEGEITALAIDRAGNLLATGGTDRAIYLWDLATGERLHCFLGRSLWFGVGHSDRITALTFSPEGRFLISASDDGTIKQWDLKTLRLVSTLSGHGWGISAMTLSEDGYLLVSGDREGRIQLWDLETETVISSLNNQRNAISAVVISPDQQLLVSSSLDKTICFWDFQTDILLKTLKGHLDSVTAATLTPNGRTLLSGSADRTIKLWDVVSASQIKVIAAHRDSITDLAVHPRELLFASSSEDNTVKLWNVQTGSRIVTLPHPWAVNQISFSPDGELLVSGSADETIRIWQRD
ncbi:MAG TPA: serine/threonine-protein kinase [Trichocoleus sp.]|jgi:hypothetical protein